MWHVKLFFKVKKIGSFGKFFKFVTLTLSCFDLGIQYESIVWVIMGQQRVSSERTAFHHDVIQMETFSGLLALCAGNSPATGEFPSQRPVTRSFDVFFHLHLNKSLSKQSCGWWSETLSDPLWRYCNVLVVLDQKSWLKSLWFSDTKALPGPYLLISDVM